MSLRAILLRLLLCIALAANGASAVYASTMMDASFAASQDGAAPCHDMPSMDAHHAAAPASMPAHDDCCPPGACLCSCVAQAQGLVALPAVAASMQSHAS